MTVFVFFYKPKEESFSFSVAKYYIKNEMNLKKDIFQLGFLLRKILQRKK